MKGMKGIRIGTDWGLKRDAIFVMAIFVMALYRGLQRDA